MSTFTVNSKIQQRYDTSTNWVSTNPVLLVGEIGIESSTGKIKAGNGVTRWNSLGYIGITTEYLEQNYLRKTAQAVSAGLADKVKQSDTRSVNTTPNAYMGQGAGQIVEFKTNITIGLSGAGTYSQIWTIIPWGDASGGYPVQVAFCANGMYKRYGTSSTAWSSWEKMVVASELRANKITITARSGLGNNTNLDSVLNYIANVFVGSQTVSKIKAGTFDTSS